MKSTRWIIVACCLLSIMSFPTLNAQAASKKEANKTKISVEQAARKIDQIIAAGHVKDKVRGNPIVSDEVFLRRAYLDIAGRIPTMDEAKQFLDGRDFSRRYDLINKLIDSPGHISHQFNYWADILRAKSRLQNNVAGAQYIQWIKDSIEQNKPYDQMVHELLTAEGYIFENGATGYYLRDSGMPLDNMANTTRVFLGTQIGCAQCHDHPFEEWTQFEFYEMAAYTYGINTRSRPQVVTDIRKISKKHNLNPDEIQTLRRMVRPLSYKVSENPRKIIKLPKDYKYDDAKPNEKVAPNTIFGESAKPTNALSPRDAFAKWMTSADNPRFAMTIANRLWKRVMGIGLIEPADDIIDPNDATNPELLEHLTQEMIRLNFNMKEFMRILYHTRHYQRSASRDEYDPSIEYHLEGRFLTRMTAEQIWDSLLTASIPNIDERQGYVANQNRYTMLKVQDKSPEELVTMAKALTNNPNKMREMIKQTMMANRPKYNINLVRASEMASPMRPGHFLRDFGQSDREMIENANSDPTLTQVLQMINGPMASQLVGKNSQLRRRVEKAESTKDKLDTIFLSLLSRYPTAAEIAMCKREIATSDNDYKAMENIVWAILNTREFVFVQ